MINRHEKVKKRHASHRATAWRRNIPFKITWQEWDAWWLAHGVDKATSPSERDANTLCMCRYNDTGAYELGNIYCDTLANNIRTSYTIRKDKNSYKNGRSKLVNTPLGQFESIKDAALAFGLTGPQMAYRLKTQPKEYYRAV